MKPVIIFLLSSFYVLIAQAKPIELILWHGMAGQLGDEVRLLTDDFNHSQKKFVVKPVYKGNYTETLTSFAAAYRAHQPPAMVQVFEVGKAIMLSPRGVIKPVDSLMQEQGINLPKEDFIQSVREFYSKDGQLMAMPFNLSAPVLYYNQDILAKVGYSPNDFPKTWDEMEILAKKIKQAGYDCTYTTAYPGWILVESYLAIHGLALTEGEPAHAVFDTPQFLTHLKRLKKWQDLHYFRYGGRVDDATVLFTSGVCPLFSQSSGAHNSIVAIAPFHIGVAVMPLDTNVSAIRHANVAGGAALWVVNGQSRQHYQGIAQFFAFIAKAKIQQRWHEHTGYLPLGLKGTYAPILQSSQHPVLLLAQKDLEGNILSKSVQNLGPQNQMRGINDEILEAMFAGLINPEEALQQAARRINYILLRFARNTQDI